MKPGITKIEYAYEKMGIMEIRSVIDEWIEKCEKLEKALERCKEQRNGLEETICIEYGGDPDFESYDKELDAILGQG